VGADYLIKENWWCAARLSGNARTGDYGLDLRRPLTSGSLVRVDTPDLLYQHDRVMRDNYWHAGGGLAYSFVNSMCSQPNIAFVGGTDTHAGRALTISVVVPFRLGGPHR